MLPAYPVPQRHSGVGCSLVELSGFNDTLAWLEKMPREVSGIVAARSALRACPWMVAHVRDDPDTRRATTMLPGFRAMALPWAAGKCSAQGKESVREAASDSADSAASALSAALSAAASALSALSAARSAAHSVARSAAHSAARSAAHSAAHSAVHSAADSAAASAVLSAADYAALSADATFLEDRLTDLKTRRAGQKQVKQACAALADEPLWPKGAPEGWTEAWEELRAVLEAAPDAEHWEVWTDWFEDRIAGHRPVNPDLELERILIADADWKKGPAHVNGLIKGLIETHTSQSETDGAANEDQSADANLDAALRSDSLQAALTDFKFDDVTLQMQMVPFREEVPTISNPAHRKALENMLSELAEGMSDLSADAAGGNLRSSLINALQRYAKEAGRDTDEVRPGRLWDVGATLNQAVWDEDVQHSLDALLFGNLKRMVEKHRELMRLYFTHALERLRKVEVVELAEGVTPETALIVLEETAKEIAETPADQLPPPAPEVIAAMQDRVDELKDILDRLHRRGASASRTEEMEDAERKTKFTGLTYLRYVYRLAEVSAIGYSVANGINYFHPQTWAKLISLFQKVPWPF